MWDSLVAFLSGCQAVFLRIYRENAYAMPEKGMRQNGPLWVRNGSLWVRKKVRILYGYSEMVSLPSTLLFCIVSSVYLSGSQAAKRFVWTGQGSKNVPELREERSKEPQSREEALHVFLFTFLVPGHQKRVRRLTEGNLEPLSQSCRGNLAM
jgi:hypothetical protein